VIVLGEHDSSSAAVTAQIRNSARAYDLPGIHRNVHGSFHLVSTRAGQTRVQGTASGLKRVYTCAVNGITIAGDDAGILAKLCGAAPDRAALAVRLLFPGNPWPLHWQSAWDLVTSVAPHDCVELGPDGRARTTRWWTAPEASLDLRDAATALRHALEKSVAVRIRRGDRVASHLAGLDSTSLVSLAAHRGADLLAMTAAQPDPIDEDVSWARRTSAELRERGMKVDHDVIPADEIPLVFADMTDHRDGLDEPFVLVHNRARLAYLVERGQEYQPTVHLTGLGGDEISTPLPMGVVDALVRRPMSGLGRLFAAKARGRWRTGQLMRDLVASRSPSHWLRALAARTEARYRQTSQGRDYRSPNALSVGFSADTVMPVWSTGEAVELVAAALRTAAETSREPLAPTRTAHTRLDAIHFGAQQARAVQSLAAQMGADLAVPFFDDHVIEVALAIDPLATSVTDGYKPLLSEAMRGIVPEASRNRQTKSDTSGTVLKGSRNHLDQLKSLSTNSRLADLGLIDEAAFAGACRRPIETRRPDLRVTATLGCEAWLRDGATHGI
jgi:asparagine synthase (glutamine-hydrolysing)